MMMMMMMMMDIYTCEIPFRWSEVSNFNIIFQPLMVLISLVFKFSTPQTKHTWILLHNSHFLLSQNLKIQLINWEFTG